MPSNREGLTYQVPINLALAMADIEVTEGEGVEIIGEDVGALQEKFASLRRGKEVSGLFVRVRIPPADRLGKVDLSRLNLSDDEEEEMNELLSDPRGKLLVYWGRVDNNLSTKYMI